MVMGEESDAMEEESAVAHEELPFTEDNLPLTYKSKVTPPKAPPIWKLWNFYERFLTPKPRTVIKGITVTGYEPVVRYPLTELETSCCRKKWAYVKDQSEESLEIEQPRTSLTGGRSGSLGRSTVNSRAKTSAHPVPQKRPFVGSRSQMSNSAAPPQQSRSAVSHKSQLPSKQQTPAGIQAPLQSAKAALGVRKSSKISELSKDDFQEFLKKKDVSLVTFYNSRTYQEGDIQSWILSHFSKASETTNRRNHAYATVDCAMEQNLCAKQKILSYPTIRLYSRGQDLGTVKDIPIFNHNMMKGMVQEAPKKVM